MCAKSALWLASIVFAFAAEAALSEDGGGDAPGPEQKPPKERPKKDEGGEKPRRFGLFYPPTIETLKKKIELTDEQVKKIEELRKTIADKCEALSQDPAVKAAQEELAKAKDAGDKDAIKAAETKLKEAMKGFVPHKEWIEGLTGILTPEQMEKIAPKHKEQGKGDKPEKKRKEEGKPEGAERGAKAE